MITQVLTKRERFYLLAGRMTSYVSVDAGSAVYLVRTQDQNVGRSLFLKQTRGEMRVLARAVALIHAVAGGEGIARRQFLDVGANIGTTTISALIDHGFGTAVCFEPEPANLLTLRLNLLLNGLEDRAHALGAAVSDVSGTAELLVDLEQGGKHQIASDTEMVRSDQTRSQPISVPAVTLDGLIERGGIRPDEVGLLWMDAQTHEGHILQGASQLVERGTPIVLEWSPKGLERSGRLAALEAIFSDRYTHFVDLRPNADQSSPRFELRSSNALREYSSLFVQPDGPNFTDIVLLRLDRAAAEQLNVQGAIERYRARARGNRISRSTATRSPLEQLVGALAGTSNDLAAPPAVSEARKAPVKSPRRDQPASRGSTAGRKASEAAPEDAVARTRRRKAQPEVDSLPATKRTPQPNERDDAKVSRRRAKAAARKQQLDALASKQPQGRRSGRRAAESQSNRAARSKQNKGGSSPSTGGHGAR
jgi:FkbM family methyltransferase